MRAGREAGRGPNPELSVLNYCELIGQWRDVAVAAARVRHQRRLARFSDQAPVAAQVPAEPGPAPSVGGRLAGWVLVAILAAAEIPLNVTVFEILSVARSATQTVVIGLQVAMIGAAHLAGQALRRAQHLSVKAARRERAWAMGLTAAAAATIAFVGIIRGAALTADTSRLALLGLAVAPQVANGLFMSVQVLFAVVAARLGWLHEAASSSRATAVSKQARLERAQAIELDGIDSFHRGLVKTLLAGFYQTAPDDVAYLVAAADLFDRFPRTDLAIERIRAHPLSKETTP